MSNSVKKFKSKKILFIFFFAFSAIWFIGSISWFFTLSPILEKDTIELTSIITEISPINFYLIKTNDYDAKLHINYKDIVIDMNKLNDLSIGDSISFRIKAVEKDKLSIDKEVIELVSLSKKNQNIITIESYNKERKKMRTQSSIGFLICGIITMAIAIIFLVSYKKNKNSAN